MRRAATWVVAAGGLAGAVALAAARAGERPGSLSDRQALALGLVQGLTELLPISSSGHLILVPWLADWRFLEQHPAFNKTFDVSLHLGTLVAVVAYFARELGVLIAAWFRSVARRRVATEEERLAWLVVIATIPAVVAGGLGEKAIEDHLGEPWQIAILLSAFGLLLWVSDRMRAERWMGSLSVTEAILVGLAQCLALVPGVSRSGVTITAGRFLGLGRDAAARFSFLLLVPVTFGAVVYKGAQDVVFGSVPPGTTGPFVVGMLAAAASGFAAISALLGYVRRNDYSPFAVYRVLVGVGVLALIASGARSAGF